MSDWKNFGDAAFKDQEGYEKSLAGGKFFSHGNHDVTIEAMTPTTSAKGNFYIRATFSADGKSINHNIFLTATDKKTGEVRLNRGYCSIFAGAIVPDDVTLKFKAFNNFFPANAQSLEALVGAKLNITIGRQKTGYTVEKVGSSFVIMDVETSLPVLLDDGIENSFEDHSDANDIAKDQGLKRAWDEVTYMRGLEGQGNVNVSLVESIMNGKSQKKKVVNM